MTHYEPPKQSAFGQFFDSIFVIVLVAATLLGSMYLTILDQETNAAAPTTEAAATETVAMPSQKLQGTPEAEALKTERFKALGWDDEKVKERDAAIAAKSYEIDWLLMVFTAIVIVGYFVFLVKASDKELRQVLAEHFDNNKS